MLLLVMLTVVDATETNSIKRFAVTCGSAILEGVLHLTPRSDEEFWTKCRFERVPYGCERSCGGPVLSPRATKQRIRACWLCTRWRVFFYGIESPWIWSSMLISACETLGFGSSEDFVNLFTSPEQLYQLALTTTIPLKFYNKTTGGGGGAGIEIWCGSSERVVWMGGGGGGGSDFISQGKGSGAGLQISLGWSLGAGVGGGIERTPDLRKQSFSFGYEKDDLSLEGAREGTAKDVDALRKYLRRCYLNHNLTVFGGGGSGSSDGSSAMIRFNFTSCSHRP